VVLLREREQAGGVADEVVVPLHLADVVERRLRRRVGVGEGAQRGEHVVAARAHRIAGRRDDAHGARVLDDQPRLLRGVEGVGQRLQPVGVRRGDLRVGERRHVDANLAGEPARVLRHEGRGRVGPPGHRGSGRVRPLLLGDGGRRCDRRRRGGGLAGGELHGGLAGSGLLGFRHWGVCLSL